MVEKINGECELCLVMEYCGLDLNEHIRKEQEFEEDSVVKILYGLLCALKYFHSAGILHRDIKPQNILVSPSLETKVCDFGYARSDTSGLQHRTPTDLTGLASKLRETRREREGRERHLSPHVVTRWYRPPEIILLQKEYSSSVDLWGAGCIVAEMLNSCSTYLNLGFNKDKRVLFRGESCYPLSPMLQGEEAAPQRDLLAVILSLLGK